MKNKLKLILFCGITCLFLFPHIGKTHTDNVDGIIGDTLVIDEAYEELEYVLHTHIESGKFKIKDFSRLKYNTTKVNFTGVIKIKVKPYTTLGDDGGLKIMTFLNGIPHGQWKGYDSKGRILYDYGVNMGFFNGTYKDYEYKDEQLDYNGESELIKNEFTYKNGFLEGPYKKTVYKFNGEIVPQTNIDFIDNKYIIESVSCRFTNRTGIQTCKGISYEAIDDRCHNNIGYVLYIDKAHRSLGIEDASHGVNVDFIKEYICNSPKTFDLDIIVSDLDRFKIEKFGELYPYHKDKISEIYKIDINEQTYYMNIKFISKLEIKNNFPVKYEEYLIIDSLDLKKYGNYDSLIPGVTDNRILLEMDTFQYYKGYMYQINKKLANVNENGHIFSSEDFYSTFEGFENKLPESTYGYKEHASESYKDSINRISVFPFIYIESKYISHQYTTLNLYEGDYLHGFNVHFDLFRIDIENKFSATANYAEGEYFFGEKTGVWNYYIYNNDIKKKIASEKYVLKKPPLLANFKLGLPINGFNCDYGVKIEDPLVTEKVIYNYENGNIIIGFYYDQNGNVIKIVK